LRGYETHRVILKDISLAGTALDLHSMMQDYTMGKEDNVGMVNGEVNSRRYRKNGHVHSEIWALMDEPRNTRLSLPSFDEDLQHRRNNRVQPTSGNGRDVGGE
jgi:hypothetical protein